MKILKLNIFIYFVSILYLIFPISAIILIVYYIKYLAAKKSRVIFRLEPTGSGSTRRIKISV